MLVLLLFPLVYLAILGMLFISMELWGVNHLIYALGGRIEPQWVFGPYLVVATTGVVAALLFGKPMARRATYARVITEPANRTERNLLLSVERLSRKARIRTPQVAIYQSSDPNSYAVGTTRNSAMIAVSSGLLKHLSPAELDAALGHEIGHIANRDMLVLGLVQSVTNTFLLAVPRVMGFLVDRSIFKNDQGRGAGFFVTLLFFLVFFSFPASLLVMWLSRVREYRADRFSARLVERDSMIAALEKLQGTGDTDNTLPDGLIAFGIRQDPKNPWRGILAFQPSFEKRIAALKKGG